MKSKQIGLDKIHTDMAKLYLQTLENSKQIESGEQIYVIVKNIKDPEFIFVESDIGAGIIPREQLLDENGNVTVNVEETIPVFFIGNKNGENYFTTIPIAPYQNIIFENAKINKIPFKGKIETILETGYQVRIGEELAFCPKSKLKQEIKIGDELEFIVIENKKNSIIVSHVDFLAIQKEQLRRKLIEQLKEGSIIKGKISNIKNFGAFVDLGYGLEAFLPLSEISYKRIEHPSHVLTLDSEIRAKVIEIDWKEDKIILSLKELEKNPWLGPLPFQQGDIIEVTIFSIKKFGLLVKLPEGFHGLIPVKEINITKQKQLHKVFQKDETVRAMITHIDKENQKISLSIKKAQEYFEQIEYKKYIRDNREEDSVNLGSILFPDS